MVCGTALAIRTNRINSLPPTIPPTDPSIGIDYLVKLRSRSLVINPVYTRSLDTSKAKAGSVGESAPWFTEMATLLQSYDYSRSNVLNMDGRGTAMGDIPLTRVFSIINRAGLEGGPKGRSRRAFDDYNQET